MDQQSYLVSRRGFVAAGAVAAAAMGLGLASCSSGESASTTEQKTETTGTVGGGDLTAAVAYETKNWHPSTTSSALSLGGNWHVVEGLYELNLTDFKPHVALAAGEPVKVSDTEYTVTLRDGAKFSDGTAVTAADVVSSYQRTNKEGNLYVPMISFIAGMTAKDDKTVSITLKYPFSLLQERLSLIKVVPTNATDDDLTKMPVGTGPWMYKAIDEKQVAFVPNPEYNGNFAAKDNTMTWEILKDDTARTTAMTQGTVLVMENVPADVQSQVEQAGAVVESVQGFNLPFLMFNTKKAPFDNKLVRQAFHYAIDVDKLISNAMSGLAAKVTSFLPENHKNYHKAATVFTYDTNKAKELLKEAGAEGLSITLDTTDHSWIKALSPQIKNDLEAAGVSVNIQEQASAALYANRTDVDAPDFDVVLAPGDPSVFGNDPDLLMSWWYGDNTWTQKRTQWKDSEGYTKLHEAMDKAVQATGEEQQKAWNDCFDILADEVPLYPLFHRQVLTGYFKDKVVDFAPIGTTGLNFVGAATQTK